MSLPEAYFGALRHAKHQVPVSRSTHWPLEHLQMLCGQLVVVQMRSLAAPPGEATACDTPKLSDPVTTAASVQRAARFAILISVLRSL
jgi:hypothetical protein